MVELGNFGDIGMPTFEERALARLSTFVAYYTSVSFRLVAELALGLV